MKKRLFFFGFLAVVFGLVFLTTLSAVTEESTGGEPELPTALTDLLSGKNSDTRETLSNIDEAHLPLALAACEALKHKSLHHDIKLSPEAVESFKSAIEARLKTSQTVFVPSRESGILPRSSDEESDLGRPGGPTLPDNSRLGAAEPRISAVPDANLEPRKNWTKIPAREIVIEGKHLTVPEYYLARK